MHWKVLADINSSIIFVHPFPRRVALDGLKLRFMSKSACSPSLEALAIGIDIGGTGTKFGIVDRNGNLLFSSEISTRGHAKVEGFIEDLHHTLSGLTEKA